MENFDRSAIQLELKYCERCGGLWLRPKGSELIFCPPCVKASSGVLGTWRRPTRTAVRPGSFDSRPEAMFWGEGGNA